MEPGTRGARGDARQLGTFFGEANAARDPRIRFKRLDTNHGIAGASQIALEMATGDYVGLLERMDVLLVVPALADGRPGNPECWGRVTAQRASTTHDLGEHSSGQSEPRLGLGNVAHALFELGLTSGPHVSDLGSFLAAVDELDATRCP